MNRWRMAAAVGWVALTMPVAWLQAAQSEITGGEEVGSAIELPSVDLHGGLSPDQAAEVFLEANAAYEEGAWAKAAAGYQRLVREGYDDGRVQFNLGNALLRSGKLGSAIASYLRSRAERPRDEDVRANLDFARQSTKDAIEPPDPSEVVSTLFFWHFRLSHRELAIAFLTVNLLFWTVLGLGLIWPGREATRWVSLLFLVLLLTLAGSLLFHRYLDRPVAVVVPQETNAHTAPEEGSVVRFKLHAGTEVRVEDRRPGWVRVSLPDGQQAWIGEEWVELVYQ